MTDTEPTTSDATIRFPSLDSLRAAHTELLKDFRADGGTTEMIAKVEAFIRRGGATGALLNTDADRWAAQSQLDYWATQIYQPGYEPPDATLDEFDPQLAPKLDDALCPYVGLDAFRELNQSVFFGREHLIGELIRKLKAVRFLAVLGSSGSGKSSVVRAGLIPELKKGALPDSADWKYFTPMVPGSNPLVNLARLIMPPDVDAAQTEIEAELYRQNSAYLAQIVSEKFSNNVVVVVDQFEEIFTLCTDELVRHRFVDNLIGLCQAPAAEHHVIITMRSDFEANIARLPKLQTMFEQAAVRITPLNASELREAIEAPAARIGLKFEEGVVDALLNDTLGEPAALPLLQFTLLKLWENRERNRVTWEAYKKLGGGRLTLARSADEVYNRLIPEEQVTMRRILLKMVRPGEGLEVTSNRVPRVALYQKAEANDRIDRVIDKLIQARLVRVSEGDIAADEQVEVAHEALVGNWPRLVEWLEEERVTLRQRQRLTTAAEEWQRLGRDPSALWRGILLEEARRYDDLNDLETKFLEASYEAEKTEIKKLQERAALLRRRALYLTVALSMTLIAVGAATFFAFQSQKQAQVSRARELALQSVVLQSNNFPASLLLSVEAFNMLDIVETRGTLMDIAQANPQLQTYLSGHTDRVSSVAFSPDGKTLASGSDDRTLILWDVETKQLIGQLRGHTDRVSSVAFSPDGKTLASGSYDGTLILWDVKTEQPVGQPLRGHTDWVRSVTFSPDGKTLASGSNDGTLILWDVETGQPVGQPFRGQTEYVSSFAFSPDGKTLASGSDDGTLILWDVKTGQPVGQPFRGRTEYVSSVAFSPDGKTLASGSDDGTLILWDAEAGQPIDQLFGQTASVLSIVFSLDGKTLASGSNDGTLILWDMETRRPIDQLFRQTASVLSVAFSPNGRTLVTGGDDGILILWDLETKQAISQPLRGHTDWVRSVAFSPDGKTLASGSRDHTLVLWNMETKQPIGEPLRRHTDWVSSVAFSPDGKTLASGSDDHTLILWDVETGQPVGQPLREHTEYVSSVAFSPDGKTLASGSYDSTLILWDVKTSRPVGQPLRGHTDWIRTVSFSPDGKTLASGGDDGTLILWDVETGQPVGQPLRGHTDWVRSVAFSPDGKTLASGSDDRTVILWDVKTQQPIGEPLRGHTDYVRSVAFSPDGKTLASGSDDRTVILWDIDPQSFIQKTCQRVGRNFTRAEWSQYFPNQEYHKTCEQWPLEPEITTTPSATP